MRKDAQLFAAAQGGDTAAFGQLVRRYEALVGAVAIASSKHTAHVEDVVQETFVAAWVRRDSLREPGKFRAWICGIARNQAAKVGRRELRSLDLAEPDAGLNAEEELLRAESSRALSEALQALPSDHREVLVLFYREEQSIREVASALQLSESAAQKRISRARDSVKARLTSILSDALPASRIPAGVGAAVLASITAGAAPASAATHGATTLTKGISIMKTAALLTTIAAMAGGLAAYSYLGEEDDAHASASADSTTHSASTAPAPAQASAPISPARAKKAKAKFAVELRRLSQAERARRFALHRKAIAASGASASAPAKASAPPSLPHKSNRDIVRATIAAVKPLLVECYDLARINTPDLAGMVAVRFKISDEPEIAGLVTEAEVSRRKGGFEPPNADFEECMQETMMSLEFIGLSTGLAVTYPFMFRQAEDPE